MSAWADKLKRRAADLQQQSAPDAGWTRGPGCWLRAGLSAEDRRAALRRVRFHERSATLDILIYKAKEVGEMTREGKCRTCGAAIFWAKSSSGAAMPIDAEPVPGGNVTIADVNSGKLAAVHGAAAQDALPPGMLRYTCHFAKCKSAAAHRRPK